MNEEKQSTTNPSGDASHRFLFKENWRDWYEVTLLFDHPHYKVTAVRERKHFEDVLFYIIELPDKVILIDTGSGFAPIEELIPKGKEILIFLTHSDWDHTGNAGELAEKVGAKVFVGGRDKGQWEVERLKKGWTPEEISGLVMEQFTGDMQPDELFLAHFFIGSLAHLPTDQFITFLFDNEGIHTMTFGEGDDQITIDVIHTPGHTPGGVCYFVRGKINGVPFGHLYSGDMIYPAFQDLSADGANAEDYEASLQFLFYRYYPEMTDIMPAHNATRSPKELLKGHLDALRMLKMATKETPDEMGKFIDKEFAGNKDTYFVLRLSEKDANRMMVKLATKHILQNLYIDKVNNNDKESWSLKLRWILSLITGGSSEFEEDYPEKIGFKKSPSKYFKELKFEMADIHEMAIKWTPEPFYHGLVDTFKELKRKLDALPDEEQESLIIPLIEIETEAENGWTKRYPQAAGKLPLKQSIDKRVS
jgi:glyoxylase-like metal-dependent hydrolase (beta-lactamase superfamily II)